MKTVPIKGISDNLQKGMTWLSKTFAESLRDPAQEAQDIYHDLVVFYLERKDKISYAPKNLDNFWYITFKNYLINKAKNSHMNVVYLTIALDKNPYENN
jgi:hypothetical protein